MKRIVLLILLFNPTMVGGAVVHTDSWEYTNVKTQSDTWGSPPSTGMYNFTDQPNYCINPDVTYPEVDNSPDAACTAAGGSYSQTIGPLVSAPGPDRCCAHSINIGGVADGFPAPVHGTKVLRTYIDITDYPVKGHTGGRAELTSSSWPGVLSPRERDRWYGFAMYIPSLANSNFTYDENLFIQWHAVTYGHGVVPLAIYLNGGERNAYRKDETTFFVQQKYTGADIRVQLTQAAIDAGRMSGANDNNPAFLLRKDGTSLNDLGDWIYFVILYHADIAASNNQGKFGLWYASQSMIDSCGTEGIDCYIHAYSETTFRTGPDGDTGNYLKFGNDQSDDNRDSDHYPILTYKDNFTVSDGSLATDALNFAEVDPAVYGAVTQYSLTTSKNGAGSGTVTSVPAGIDCGADCTEDYNENTVVTLSQVAGGGSEFAGWSGDCSGTGSCQVTMNQARNVTATFNLTAPAESPGVMLRGVKMQGVSF